MTGRVKTLKMTVNNAMKVIASKEELSNYNFAGSGNKIGFKKLDNIIKGIGGMYYY